MEIEVKNTDNLTDNEIHDFVTRVKVFLLNNNNIILVNSDGSPQLPGGHVEDNEKLSIAVVREIKEETGISLNTDEVSAPFFEIKRYTKNHDGNGRNKLSKIVYYLIRTNQLPKENERSLTDHEKEHNYKTDLVPLNNLENLLQNTIDNYKKESHKIIATEILYAFNKLKNNFKI